MGTNRLSLSQNASVPSCPRVPPACTTAPELEKPLENALGQGEGGLASTRPLQERATFNVHS